MTAPAFDPRSARAHADPYPLYRQMREQDPVQHVPSARLWFLTRHADCLAVLRDPRFSARHGQRIRVRRRALPTSMLTSDPPEHTRLRAAVAPVFGSAAMGRCRPWIDRAVEERLRVVASELAGGAEVDLISGLTRPLASRVLGTVLGVPAAETDLFAAWAAAVSVQLDPFADPDPDGPADVAMAAMLDRFADHLHDRSIRGRDDAFTVLSAAHDRGSLTAGEALSTVALLVVGGFEPLADMLGNAIAALLAASARAPAPGPGARIAVEELLRFDPPIPFTARTATREVRIDGRVVRPGDGVVAILGAANRDDRRFPRPDTMDLGRPVDHHLSFGAGPHTCLGAPLARLVARSVLTGMSATLPPLAPGVAAAVRRPGTVPRGYLRLPVRADAGQLRSP